MTDWKRKKIWLEQETDLVYTPKNIFYWRLQAQHGKQFKTTTGRKYNLKTVGYITPITDHYPMNG